MPLRQGVLSKIRESCPTPFLSKGSAGAPQRWVIWLSRSNRDYSCGTAPDSHRIFPIVPRASGPWATSALHLFDSWVLYTRWAGGQMSGWPGLQLGLWREPSTPRPPRFAPCRFSSPSGQRYSASPTPGRWALEPHAFTASCAWLSHQLMLRGCRVPSRRIRAFVASIRGRLCCERALLLPACRWTRQSLGVTSMRFQGRHSTGVRTTCTHGSAARYRDWDGRPCKPSYCLCLCAKGIKGNCGRAGGHDLRRSIHPKGPHSASAGIILTWAHLSLGWG